MHAVAEAVTDRVLTPVQVRALSTRSDAAGAARLALHGAFFVGAGFWVATAGPVMIWPAMFVLGLVQVALFAPAHECMHRTAFRSDRANTIVGWLAAAPSLLNLDFYRSFHLAHHRHTQIPGRDPELAAIAPNTLSRYVLRVSGLAFWQLRLRVVWDAWRGDFSAYPYVSEQAAPRVIFSVRAMSASLFGGSIVAALLFGWQTPILFWIIPQLIGQPPLRAYLLAEHSGCTEDRNGLTNTRTTHTNILIRLLMWNMPYHAEHHLYPSIPFHRLAAAHTVIGQRLGFVQHGYMRWNIGWVRALLAGAAQPAGSSRRPVA